MSVELSAVVGKAHFSNLQLVSKSTNIARMNLRPTESAGEWTRPEQCSFEPTVLINMTVMHCSQFLSCPGSFNLHRATWSTCICRRRRDGKKTSNAFSRGIFTLWKYVLSYSAVLHCTRVYHTSLGKRVLVCILTFPSVIFFSHAIQAVFPFLVTFCTSSRNGIANFAVCYIQLSKLLSRTTVYYKYIVL